MSLEQTPDSTEPFSTNAGNNLSYRTIESPVHAEISEKRSRFLCRLLPLASEAAVSEHLALARKDYPDASHHCNAWRLVGGSERYSDDGEPSGTAGRPMLHVLQRHSLANVLAVVTRYFGGTLLGTGGLVHAYTQTVVDAVRAAIVVEYVPYNEYEFVLPYSAYDLALRLLSKPGWQFDAHFTDTVLCSLRVPQAEDNAVQSLLTPLTRDAHAAIPKHTRLHPVRVPTM